MKIRKISLLLLAGLLASGSFASCSGATDKDDVTDSAVVDGSADSASVITEEIDPFADFDYGGADVRILVSANDYDGHGSSAFTIIEEEEENGDVVLDAVYKRNTGIEDLLNVNFVHTENTDDYTMIPTTLQNLIMAGDDAYDLVIHDLFPLATLSVQGYFLNVSDNPYVDFSQPYWYEDFMSDLSFGIEDIHYLLAGDYFLDILRTAHALYFNKDMFRMLFESPDELYDAVLAGTWTHEKFLQYASAAYSDINGDGKKDDEDRYGYCHIGYFGSMFPWAISSDIKFLEYDNTGAPKFAMNNERSIQLLESLNKIFYDEATHNYAASVEDNNNAFINGHALFGGYQRVHSLETFRDMETDIGILPYPKMDENQENYITAVHDTTNVGAIPMTCGNFEMMGAVLEVLNRESAEIVMPAYYEKALKIKYSRDDASSQMLDIIRNGISCVFPVAFNNYCNGFILGQAFSTPLSEKSTDFVSNYVKYEDAAQDKLDELWEAFDSIDR